MNIYQFALGDARYPRSRLLALIALCMVALSGCNTIAGAGEDIEEAGDEVQEEAQEHESY